MPHRYAPAIPLPPYAYIPGHDLPHPVTDPRGHLFSQKHDTREPCMSAAMLSSLPSEPSARRQALAATCVTNAQWLYALDLFNEGFYWEAHEAWESFWHALGRTTPEAQFVQGLIHLTAACVKVREGKPVGVQRHAQRARELLEVGLMVDQVAGGLGISRKSLIGVLAELDAYTPACWHTSSAGVVRVLDATLELTS